MPTKRRAPPPPPQGEESSTEESSSGEEEEEAQAVPTPQSPPQNPKPLSTAAANDDDDDDESSEGSDDEEESSDSQDDAEAFQLRQVERLPSKPSAAAPQLESADKPEPIQKKETKNLKGDAGKKRLAPEPIPSGKDKKAKAKVEKAPLEPSVSDHDKKSKSGAEKLTPSGKAKKLKAEPEKATRDSLSSPSKSEKKKWTLKDELVILKAAAGHVKTTGTQPSAGELVTAVGDSLDRKKCSYTEMYDKVRALKQRYEKAASAGALPSDDDELQKYKLSEAVWGENTKDVALASISKKDGTPSKSKKGQSNKEKIDVHSKGGPSKEATTAKEETIGTQADSKKGQVTKRKIDGDTKNMSSKKTKTTDVQAKNKNYGYRKEEAVEDAKTSTPNEAPTTAATKEKMDVGAKGKGPKDAKVATQNGGTNTENGKTQDGMEKDGNVQRVRRGLNELRNLYPNLTSFVESIKAWHPCGETLMRAFHSIDDQKASALESKIKKLRVDEVKMEVRQGNTKKELVNILLEFVQ